MSGWEAADGAKFWFSTRSFENRKLIEEVGGVAQREVSDDSEDSDDSGEIRFSQPQKYVRSLPVGAIFPTAHIRELVDAAKRGGRQVTRIVFDGTTEESPFEISSFIGRELPLTADVPEPLEYLRAWPFRLAYFKVGSVEPSPEFEMSVIIFENGIAGDMVYDYDTFSMNVRLRRVEILPAPSC